MFAPGRQQLNRAAPVLPSVLTDHLLGAVSSQTYTHMCDHRLSAARAICSACKTMKVSHEGVTHNPTHNHRRSHNTPACHTYRLPWPALDSCQQTDALHRTLRQGHADC